MIYNDHWYYNIHSSRGWRIVHGHPYHHDPYNNPNYASPQWIADESGLLPEPFPFAKAIADEENDFQERYPDHCGEAADGYREAVTKAYIALSDASELATDTSAPVGARLAGAFSANSKMFVFSAINLERRSHKKIWQVSLYNETIKLALNTAKECLRTDRKASLEFISNGLIEWRISHTFVELVKLFENGFAECLTPYEREDLRQKLTIEAQLQEGEADNKTLSRIEAVCAKLEKAKL